jgi:hypothetical protein
MTPTKLNSARTVSEIVNADVSATAAIAGTKIAPNFGSQNVVTTGNVGVGTAAPRSALDINNGQLTGVANIAGQANTSGYSIWGGLDFANSAYMQLYGSAHPTLASVLSFGTSSAERMRITAAGGVGVGTVSILAGSLLSVSQGVAARVDAAGQIPFLQLYNSNAGADLKTWRIGGNSDGRLSVETVNDAYSASNERVTVTAAGNVGIAINNPRGRIDIAGGVLAGVGNMHGNSNSGGFSIWGGESSLNGGWIQFQAGSSAAPNLVVFGNNSTETMRITAGGNVGIGTSSPSSRLHVEGDLTMSSATTTAGAGAVVEYLVVSINGTSRKIPVHATT